MCISAGQRIGRTEIFSGRLLTEAREVRLARRNLDPIIEASTFRVGATPFNSPLTAIPNTISFADSAFANPATLMCEMPPLPVLIPPLPELEQEQPTTLELPPFQLSDLREYFSVITFLTPGSAIKGPLSEPEDEARVTIGDENELRVVLQAMSPEMIIILTVVSGISLFGIPMAIAAISDVRTEKRINAQREYFSSNQHSFHFKDIKPTLWNIYDIPYDNYEHPSYHNVMQNLNILTNSEAYRNSSDAEHAIVLAKTLQTRLIGLGKAVIPPDLHLNTAKRELTELRALTNSTNPELHEWYTDIRDDAAKLGITPEQQLTSESANFSDTHPEEAGIDRLRERAAAQRAQEARSPAKAKAGKPE